MVNHLGNIIVADALNHKIRKITKDKVITIAGSQEGSFRNFILIYLSIF
jgi:hypothetical protein